MTKETFNREVIVDEEPLLPHETPWEEFLRIFKKDRMAIGGCLILVALLVAAMTGKVLTEWVVVFDAEVVRLPDKFLPPLSTPSKDVVQPQDQPVLGMYLFGTDELGRDVFARMLQGSFVSLSIGFIAVGISVFIGILLGGLAGVLWKIKVRNHDSGYPHYAIYGCDALLSYLLFDSDRGGPVAPQHLQYHDYYWAHQLDGNSSFCSSRISRLTRARFRDSRASSRVAGTTDHFSTYGSQCHWSCSRLGHHWSGHRHSHGVRSKFFRLWRSASLCHLGEYPI